MFRYRRVPGLINIYVYHHLNFLSNLKGTWLTEHLEEIENRGGDVSRDVSTVNERDYGKPLKDCIAFTIEFFEKGRTLDISSAFVEVCWAVFCSRC